MVACRKAEAVDAPAIIALWEAVFGDDAATIAHILDAFAGRGNVFVAEGEGTLQASLLAVPCHAGNGNGVYLYALATKPECRGYGVMSGLMKFAEEEARSRGAAFSALIPASDSLFGFYEKRGYKTASMRLLGKDAEAKSVADISFSTLTPEQYLGLRGSVFDRIYKNLHPIHFSLSRTAFILDDLAAEGYGAAVSGAGYAIYHTETSFVAELAADEVEAERLLCAIAGRTGKSRFLLTLPAQFGPFPGEGEPFGEMQVKWLGTSVGERPSLYLRFALDEISHRMKSRNLI